MQPKKYATLCAMISVVGMLGYESCPMVRSRGVAYEKKAAGISFRIMHEDCAFSPDNYWVEFLDSSGRLVRKGEPTFYLEQAKQKAERLGAQR